MSANSEETQKKNMLAYVKKEVDIAERDISSGDHIWSSKQRGNWEAEAFVLWYQVNE